MVTTGAVRSTLGAGGVLPATSVPPVPEVSPSSNTALILGFFPSNFNVSSACSTASSASSITPPPDDPSSGPLLGPAMVGWVKLLMVGTYFNRLK